MNKSYIHIKDLKKEEISEVFHIADKMKKGIFTDRPLAGKTIVLFFPDSSIRTRITFERAVFDLGGHSILFPPEALDKKEDIRDVIGYLENWVDGIVVRHSSLALMEQMAEIANIPIINAMTSENHPCEILSDLFSLSKIRADFLEAKYLFVGAKGNIGNSWSEAAKHLGFSLEQCCPPGYELDGVKVHRDIKEAIRGKDIICTDSISEKLQKEFAQYQITTECMKMAGSGAILNPCPPFFRGEEVSAEVIESEYFAGYPFKKHLLEVQQAILCYLLAK